MSDKEHNTKHCTDNETIALRRQRVVKRIQEAAQQAGRSATDIALVAVSKTRPAEYLRQAWLAGQRHFGENYVQEALDKQEQLKDLDITWHFIGPIQSNKTRVLSERFDWVHSVDRLKIAQRLSTQRPASMEPLKLCLQVNLDREEQKAGIDLQDLPQLTQEVVQLPRLNLKGLMAIPAPRQHPAQQQQSLRRLTHALHQLNREQNLNLDTLSMGMSADLEAAVLAGSTMVRIGTDIFGPRPTPKS